MNENPTLLDKIKKIIIKFDKYNIFHSFNSFYDFCIQITKKKWYYENSLKY